MLEVFRGLDQDIEGSPKRWRKLVESECPERERLPLDWKKKNTLQRLIILRALRPDRMSYALRWEVSDNWNDSTMWILFVNDYYYFVFII